MQNVIVDWYFSMIHNDIFLSITVPAIAVSIVYLFYRIILGITER